MGAEDGAEAESPTKRARVMSAHNGSDKGLDDVVGGSTEDAGVCQLKEPKSMRNIQEKKNLRPRG